MTIAGKRSQHVGKAPRDLRIAARKRHEQRLSFCDLAMVAWISAKCTRAFTFVPRCRFQSTEAIISPHKLAGDLLPPQRGLP
jgi:hypothetical protein